MSTDNYPNQNNEYAPNLDAQDEDLASGGNNRLFYILGALMLALIIGYVALPKGQGEGLSSVTPTFMLDDAAVTATTTVPTSADSIAAGLKAAPVPVVAARVAATSKAVGKPVVAARAAAAPVAVASVTPAVPVSVAAAPVAAPQPAAAPAAPAPAAAPQPTAPAHSTLTGRIEDENGRPLVGATVLLRGSGKGTSTDANGNYSIEIITGADNMLVYGYGGYEDEVVRARGNQHVNVTLAPREKTGKKRR